MPEISFQYHVPQKMIGTFVVDAFIAEHYQFSNSVTDIPVEEGGTIADHIVEDQDVISVEAFIGNTAFEVITKDGNSVSNLKAPDRMAWVRQAYQELKKLTKAKRPLDVVLGLETFTNPAMGVRDNVRDEAMAWINGPECEEFCHALGTDYKAVREKAAALYRRFLEKADGRGRAPGKPRTGARLDYPPAASRTVPDVTRSRR
jgi:hypothetical protein